MEMKKYSSYAEIDHDLEIFRLEKQIHYKKIMLSIDKTKESILPSRSVSFLSGVYQKVFSGTLGTVLKLIIPYGINWYMNRKRGN